MHLGERMKNFGKIGVQIPDILLPKPGIDLCRWAVIACDQYTSQPDYWENVERLVEGAPSTYHLILPEVILGTQAEEARIPQIQSSMKAYLDGDIFQPFDGMILVERIVSGKTRHGLMLCLDLEAYDYSKGSRSLIRATEGTIIERLPPRMRIREGAPLELPHILVLIDDPEKTVIEPLVAQADRLPLVYDFDLMLGSGHLTGHYVNDRGLEQSVISALENLADPHCFRQKYQVGADQAVLLFAMGDGNHSLATAKAIWENIKSQVGMDHPARYALVEIENVHDRGLAFEPIHRVLFDVREGVVQAMQAFYQGPVRYTRMQGCEEMVDVVQNQSGPSHRVGLVMGEEFGVVEITQPISNLPVGSLQPFLDSFLKRGGASKIDYVHGEDITCELAAQPANVGFYLPAMDKSELFRTVILDGALPRKTFSMGEAHEKRFYMECRKIV
jgi:hypothetical protein